MLKNACTNMTRKEKVDDEDAAAALKYALIQLGRSRSKQFTAEKMLAQDV